MWGKQWLKTATVAVEQYGALQIPSELAMWLALADSMEAKGTAIEIGAADGGLTWALAQLPGIDHVVTVDIDATPGRMLSPSLDARLTAIQGNSGHLSTYNKLAAAIDGEHVSLLVIDADHTGESPRRDWETYSPLVAPFGMVVLHDTQGYPGRDDFVVGELWHELRDAYESVELVAHPGGPGGTGVLWMAYPGAMTS